MVKKSAQKAQNKYENKVEKAKSQVANLEVA